MGRLDLTDFERDELQMAYNALCSAGAHLDKIDTVVIGINGLKGELAAVRQRLGTFAFPHAKELD